MKLRNILARCKKLTYVAILAPALVVTACSSSGSGSANPTTSSPDSAAAGTSTAGASSSSSGASANGSPVRIMLVGQLQATNFAFPDMQDAATAAVKAANDAGGINGRPIRLDVCNDQGSPNVAASCARTAVSNKDVALVGGLSEYYPQIFPTIKAAGIPIIGAWPQDDVLTSPLSFPLDPGSVAAYSAAASAMVKKGCTSVGILYDAYVSAVKVQADQVAQAVKADGAAAVQAPITSSGADFSAPVSKMLGQGVKCAMLVIAPAEAVPAYNALRQSAGSSLLIGDSVSGASALLAEGSKVSGLFLGSGAFDATQPQVSEAVAQIKQQNPKVQLTPFGLMTWAAVNAFVQIAKSINGDITPSSVLAAANATKSLTSPVYPRPINFAKPAVSKVFSRIKNTTALLYTFDGGKLTYKGPQDMTKSLAVMTATS